MKKQTAVEFLVKQLTYKTISGIYPMDGTDDVTDIVNKAKEMEKEQIMDAYIDGSLTGCGCYDYMEKKDAEQYYNETFKSE